MAKNRSKFKVFKGKDSQWYWSLYAPNHKIILSSEGYTSKWMAIKGTVSVRWNSLFENRFSDFKSIDPNKKQKYWFVLFASNGEIIGKSENYLHRSGMENGIESTRKNARFASLVVES